MATEAIRCPECNSKEFSPIIGGDYFRCDKCKVYFRVVDRAQPTEYREFVPRYEADLINDDNEFDVVIRFKKPSKFTDDHVKAIKAWMKNVVHDLKIERETYSDAFRTRLNLTNPPE